jgi:hypothetical protein
MTTARRTAAALTFSRQQDCSRDKEFNEWVKIAVTDYGVLMNWDGDVLSLSKLLLSM